MFLARGRQNLKRRLATTRFARHLRTCMTAATSALFGRSALYEPRPRLSIRSRPRGPCFFSNASRNLTPSSGLNAIDRITGCSAGCPNALAIRKPYAVSPSAGAAFAPNCWPGPRPIVTAIVRNTAETCKSQRFYSRITHICEASPSNLGRITLNKL